MSRIYDALRRSGLLKPNEEPRISSNSTSPWVEPEEVIDDLLDGKRSVPRVACHPTPGAHVMLTGRDQSIGLERLRGLRHRLQMLREKQNLRTLLITSPLPKEGKTLLSINLAATLALTPARVLLIDGDLRKPNTNQTLGIDPLYGLFEHLEGRLDLAGAIRRIDPIGVYYLSSGRGKSEPGEILQHPGMKQMLARVAAAFDWVVVDSPPVNLFADTHHLSTLVDAVLIVVRSGVTTPESLKQALEALGNSPVAGVVLNGYDDLADEGGYHYSYAAYLQTKSPSKYDRKGSPSAKGGGVKK